MIDSKAKLLDHRQVSADSVQAVHVEPCRHESQTEAVSGYNKGLILGGK